MILKQILQLIDVEKKIGSRFPVRIIFVEQLQQYKELVHNLTQVCDKVLCLSAFCKADDIFPNFRHLQKYINASQEKQIVVLSTGEYLRLGLKRELNSARAQFPSLWQSQQEAASKTRVIIPLFACKELFERIVQSIDERQQGNLWTLDPNPEIQEVFHLQVYSPQFSKVIIGNDIIFGLEKWLQEWDKHISSENCAIITSLYNNVENTSGAFNVRVIDNPFRYVANIVLDGHKLKKDWGSEEQWAAIIPDIAINDKLSKAIEGRLNVQKFEPVSILAKWNIMDEVQRWLVWLWYRLNETDDYYGYVISNSATYEDIEKAVCNAILDVVSQRPEWIEQRVQAMEALKIDVIDESFWDKLDSLPLPETKLKILTYRTHDERTYAIRTISRWLRRGAAIEAVIEYIADKYPLLYAYFMADCSALPDQLVDYFDWYKMKKIKNEYPSTEENEIDKVHLDVFDSRFSKLQPYIDKDAFILWVDGMGIEWLPLLLTCIKNYQPDAKPITDIACAILPTETYINAQWNDVGLPFIKINKLDILAHKGMLDDKDYFSCIDYQLSIIDEVAKKAVNMLDSYNYVIITADHGSSRMAALSFHDTLGIASPMGANVKSYGRYCELHETLAPTDMLPCARPIKNKDCEYLVMTTHEHYMQSGNPAGGNDDNNAVVGEIHGGMTPEEYLIPVVVIKRNVSLKPLDYNIISSTVYRDMHSVKITLEFNRSISKLEVVADSIDGECICEQNKLWSVSFANLGLQTYTIDVYANERLLTRHEKFTVKAKGINRNDDPFGGF